MYLVCGSFFNGFQVIKGILIQKIVKFTSFFSSSMVIFWNANHVQKQC